MSVSTPFRVAVVGGGVAGTFCATVLAQGLQSLGRGGEVHLFDSGRSLGGRASTRLRNTTVGNTAPGASSSEIQVQYDHGAQFFRATHPHVKQILTSPLTAGLVGQWNARVGILGRRGGKFLPVEVIKNTGVLSPSLQKDDEEGADDDAATSSKNELDFCGHLQGPPYFVGMPTMRSLCEGICLRSKVRVHSSTEVVNMEWHPPTGHSTAPGEDDFAWNLTTLDLGGEPSSTQDSQFDHVVLATHSPGFAAAQLEKLISHDFEDSVDAELDDPEAAAVKSAAQQLSSLLAQQEHIPARTLMVTLSRKSAAEFEAAAVHGSPILQWIARDSSKPGRQSGSETSGAGSATETWVAHATDEFARETSHIDNHEDSAEQRQGLCNTMLEELQLLLQRHEADLNHPNAEEPLSVVHAETQRWGSGFLAQDGPGAVNISAVLAPDNAADPSGQQVCIVASG